MNTKDLQTFIRSNGLSWPGCYPMVIVMADGEVIDAQSARENYRRIRECMRNPLGASRDWTPIALDIHFEGEALKCAHSGRMIESSYGVLEGSET